jgi:hypothetical protein
VLGALSRSRHVLAFNLSVRVFRFNAAAPQSELREEFRAVLAGQFIAEESGNLCDRFEIQS